MVVSASLLDASGVTVIEDTLVASATSLVHLFAYQWSQSISPYGYRSRFLLITR